MTRTCRLPLACRGKRASFLYIYTHIVALQHFLSFSLFLFANQTIYQAGSSGDNKVLCVSVLPTSQRRKKAGMREEIVPEARQ